MSSEQQIKPFPINVRGQKVALGPVVREHLETLNTFRQDVEVVLHSDGEFTPSIVEDEIRWFEKRDPLKSISFAIYELENLTLLGTVGLRHINNLHGVAIFGISIGRKEFWGKGYGTEATKLTLEYGFRFLNLYTVHLDTISFNERAQRAYLKAGFKEIGRRRGVVLSSGKRYDEVLMECLASEFEPPKPGWFHV